MKQGDYVKVFLHVDPSKSLVARVVLISDNENSIAVNYDDRPPEGFPLCIHALYGPVLFAFRVCDPGTGKPIGPWVELFTQGHYEIEPVPPMGPKQGVS